MSQTLKDSLKTGHVICILEGTAEEVIIKKLFGSNKLVFKNRDVCNGEKLIRKFTKTRAAKKFAEENLKMDYGSSHVNILRILDSKREKFNLGRVYEGRILAREIRVFNILTRPEIEILIIIAEGHYERFTNRAGKIKANIYCERELKLGNIKSARTVTDYFTDEDKLISSIVEYNRLHAKRGELSIFDLLESP